MSRRVLRALALGLFAPPLLASSPARAGFWEPEPEPQPPPIHVYDYTRGPVWTPNGWAQVPVEVHFPRTRPTVVIPPQNVEPPPPPPRKVRIRTPGDYEPVGPKSKYDYAPMPLPNLPPRKRPTK